MSIQSEIRASIFTAEQEQQLRQLKAAMPFRIVWGGVSVQTEPHTFEMHADFTRHKLTSYLRKGWLVATIS